MHEKHNEWCVFLVCRTHLTSTRLQQNNSALLVFFFRIAVDSFGCVCPPMWIHWSDWWYILKEIQGEFAATRMKWTFRTWWLNCSNSCQRPTLRCDWEAGMMGVRACKVKVTVLAEFSRSSPGAAVLRTAFKQLEGRSVKLPPIDFFSSAFCTNVPAKSELRSFPPWLQYELPVRRKQWKASHWHCYSDHSSTEKDAGCAHAWLSLGPNLLSILRGSNHNNGRLAKSKEVGGLFIWLNKTSLNAQITTTSSNPLQRPTIVFLPTSTCGSNKNKTMQKHLQHKSNAHIFQGWHRKAKYSVYKCSE